MTHASRITPLRSASGLRRRRGLCRRVERWWKSEAQAVTAERVCWSAGSGDSFDMEKAQERRERGGDAAPVGVVPPDNGRVCTFAVIEAAGSAVACNRKGKNPI